jgi:hypothetical protein
VRGPRLAPGIAATISYENGFPAPAALEHDPYNEAVYQEIMHIQARLGRPGAARRTLALLEARLAGLGLSPAPATRQAAEIPPGDPSAAPLSAPPRPRPAGKSGPAPGEAARQ